MSQMQQSEYLTGTVSEGDPELIYNRLVDAGRQLINSAGWGLGKLANQVDISYGEDRLGKFAADIDTNYKTLLNARTVYRAWPEDTRPDDLVFGVAKALAAQPDRLELVLERPAMTVREARQLIIARADATVPPIEPSYTDEPVVVRKLSRTLKEYASQIPPDRFAEVLDKAAKKARRQAKQQAAIEGGSENE